MFEVSAKELEKVLRDFYNLTKFKIVLYDSDRNVLYTHPEKMCKFCEAVRENEILLRRCIGCDNMGFDMCDRTGEPYIYKCHMSIVEAIAPIYSSDIIVGYLMLGQVLSDGKDDVLECIKRVKKELGAVLDEKLVDGITSADDTYIRSAVSMMSMCANYLYTNEIIRNKPNVFVYQLKQYIRANLDADLSVDALCSHFYVSPTKLYVTSRDSFGMGISDYVRCERIKKAKHLLANTNFSVGQVGAEVGIRDANYFIRTFKRSEGMTPLAYRAKKQSK